MQKPDAKSPRVLARVISQDTSNSNSLVSIFRWLFYLPVHFPVHIAGLNFLAMSLFAIAHSPEMAFLSGCGAVIAMAQLRSTRSTVVAAKQKAKASISVLQSNVLFKNKNYDLFHQYVRAKQADVIAVEEVTEEWERAAREAGLFEDYPYYVSGDVAHDDVRCKVALLGKEPFDSVSVEYANDSDPTIIASRRYGDAQVNFVVAHPRPPVAPRFFERQLEHFQYLENLKSSLKGSTILLGDFNSSPWLPQFKKMIAALSLRDVRDDFGDEIVATWPAPLQAFGLPLDYCLVTSKLHLTKFETGPSCGSDHVPLYVSLDLVE